MPVAFGLVLLAMPLAVLLLVGVWDLLDRRAVGPRWRLLVMAALVAGFVIATVLLGSR